MDAKESQPMSLGKLLVLGLFSAFVLLLVVSSIQSTDRRQEVAAKETAMTPEQKAKRKAEGDKKAAQQAIAASGAVSIMRAMKDPAAFTLTSLYLMPDGTSCYEYRAKNSFGAIFPSEAVLTIKGKMLLHELHGNAFVSAWNDACTKPGGEDITDLVNDAVLSKR